MGKRPCRPGCGQTHRRVHGENCLSAPRSRYWCSQACRLARRPQNPTVRISTEGDFFRIARAEAKRIRADNPLVEAERRRIRRAIAPALKDIRRLAEIRASAYMRSLCEAIDAATRATRKGRAR